MRLVTLERETLSLLAQSAKKTESTEFCNPHVLSCLQVFCESCLQEMLMDETRDSGKRDFIIIGPKCKEDRKMTDNIAVAVRVRPLVTSEILGASTSCIECVPGEPQITIKGSDKTFAFNYVFGPSICQETFYNTGVKGLVKRLFEGFNVTILAYGQTGSGKTYSMGTSYTDDTNVGVIPRALKDIFLDITRMPEWDFDIKVSFMELYREQLYDLLASDRVVVEIREDPKGIRIPGLTEKVVKSYKDTVECLMKGSSGRATGATAMNPESSRSHAIFTVTIQQQRKGDIHNSTSSKFHLVDLAGSERPKKTKTTGERFKEGVTINKGLLALGNVISALGEGNPKSYISYRDSKLTRLLQDSLGGNSYTLMIACVSPADFNVDETISTLRYADRARHIKNKPIVNQDPKDKELLNLKQQISDLQLELLSLKSGALPIDDNTTLRVQYDELLSENNKLREAFNNVCIESSNVLECALLAEEGRNQMKLKLCEIQEQCSHVMESFNESVIQENCPAEFLLKLQYLRDLHVKIRDLQIEQKRGAEEVQKHELSSDVKDNISPVEESNDEIPGKCPEVSCSESCPEDPTMKQVELNRELQDLNKMLALKEQLAAQLVANSHDFSCLKESHQQDVSDLENQISILQREKEELLEIISVKEFTSSKGNPTHSKRLSELEQKILELKKKLLEQDKLIKVKAKSDEKIICLNQEIQAMKQSKVRLIKQMKIGSEQFRAWKLQREKELRHLRTQELKRETHFARMERLHDKQQNVLRRKVEQAAAVNKKLKDALAVQKATQDRHAHHDFAGLQQWISQELDVAVQTAAAEGTLESLVEDRIILNKELMNLKDAFSEERVQDMNKLQELISLRSTQILDLKQKIIDAEQENKDSTRWDHIQHMSDAKYALQCLFTVAKEVKTDNANKDSMLDDLKLNQKSIERKWHSLEEQLRESAQVHKEEMLHFQTEHEEKIRVIMKQQTIAEDPCMNTNSAELPQNHDESMFKVPKRTRYRPTLSSIDDEDELLETNDDDSDWKKTRLYRRILKIKKSAVKRDARGGTKCSCKGGNCITKCCMCCNIGSSCTSTCKCDALTCENRPSISGYKFGEKRDPICN